MAAKFLWFVGYVKVVTVFKTNHDICCRLPVGLKYWKFTSISIQFYTLIFLGIDCRRLGFFCFAVHWHVVVLLSRHLNFFKLKFLSNGSVLKVHLLGGHQLLNCGEASVNFRLYGIRAVLALSINDGNAFKSVQISLAWRSPVTQLRRSFSEF